MLYVYERRVHISLEASPECRNGCVYCYSPYVSPVNRFPSTDHMMQALKHDKDRYDMIGQGCEQELFTDQARAIEIMNMWASLGKIILFSTKTKLTDGTIEALKHVDGRLKNQGSYLFAQVSMVSGITRRDLEPCAPSVEDRIDTLERLSAAGIYTSAYIKPLLPETIVPMHEIMEIVDKTAGFADCYVIGSFYFEPHILRNMRLMERIDKQSWGRDIVEDIDLGFLDEKCSDDKRSCTGKKQLGRFFRYLDENRVDELVGYIKLRGGIVFTKTTPAVLSFRD